VEYTYKTNWGKVQNDFYRRQNEAYITGIRTLESKKKVILEKERRKSSRMHVDNETGEAC